MDTTRATIETKKEWFNNHSDEYPLLCYMNNNGTILGWASLSKWSEKTGYRFTSEISIYVSKNAHNSGIGTALIQECLNKAKKSKLHCIVSRIDSENKVSLALHKKFGFTEVGVMREFGFKFNRYIDIVLLQLLI